MTKRLSNAFFGDKKLTQSIYAELTSKSNQKPHRFTEQQIQTIFAPYTNKLHQINSTVQSNLSLLSLFTEFMSLVTQKFQHWSFQKFSSTMQIAAHVFEYSFENWLSKDQSYKYFSEVVVRHSLFRPPHSVAIFTYDQMKQIIQFWIEHFLRFYEEYEESFKSQLHETINAIAFPQRTGISNFILRQRKYTSDRKRDQQGFCLKFDMNIAEQSFVRMFGSIRHNKQTHFVQI